MQDRWPPRDYTEACSFSRWRGRQLPHCCYCYVKTVCGGPLPGGPRSEINAGRCLRRPFSGYASVGAGRARSIRCLGGCAERAFLHVRLGNKTAHYSVNGVTRSCAPLGETFGFMKILISFRRDSYIIEAR